ncbi:MAG TPA: ATP-binding protein [Terriglobales bacterium]|nr:ATP-binding protein [Terriglobales bacterium]
MKLPRMQWWLPVALTCLAGCSAAALLMQPGYWLAVVGNVVQSGLLLAFLILTIANAVRVRGNARLFWVSMGLGVGLWLAATLMWTWFEVVVQKTVPVPFVGDVLFFVHVVPMIGALALRPHRHSARRLDLAGLDLSLLLLWWIYLYGFVVLPAQYVVQDAPQYGFNFNLLYVVENAVLLVVLAILCARVQGPWRRVYVPFMAAASVYAIGSQVVNGAITRGQYHTGSLYDLPLVVAMLLFIWMGLRGLTSSPRCEPGESSRSQEVFFSRLAVAAVLSIPVIGATNIILRAGPREVIRFRSLLTMVAMIVLPSITFLKQRVLDRELVKLLGISEQNFHNLKRLQAQLVQAEKLSAIGHFVARAAHEINNPLTAIIGYSDLLQQECNPDDHRHHWVVKISQQARRTQELVKQLLTFSRQAPAQKSLLKLNPLLENAIELREIDVHAEELRIIRRLDPALPDISGDANQLLQVCFQIIGNAIDAMKGKGELIVSTRLEVGQAVIEFADSGPGVEDAKRIFDPFYTTKPLGQGPGLGLSACYGIISAHGGTIVCENREKGGAVFTVRLPIHTAAAAKA